MLEHSHIPPHILDNIRIQWRIQRNAHRAVRTH